MMSLEAAMEYLQADELVENQILLSPTQAAATPKTSPDEENVPEKPLIPPLGVAL